MDTASRIETILRERLEASVVDIEDESRLHAGHAGAAGGGGHFNVVVVSPRFAGLATIKRHRLVYEALADEMKSAIHALSLKTLTPEQWQG